MPTQPILIPVSAGELIDKITILQIKASRITEARGRTNVERELQLLSPAEKTLHADYPPVAGMADQLREVNERLWAVEDALRACEQEKDFGRKFIELARSVYQLNDRRAELKRGINELCRSAIVEEKWYSPQSVDN
jgi:hypothetical protein